ncbi:MAG: hypothetical protein GX617_12220, partial [Lentisphaerae bacterium]|nr:hypothetical protein [Lentisphaerota bacterium]
MIGRIGRIGRIRRIGLIGPIGLISPIRPRKRPMIGPIRPIRPRKRPMIGPITKNERSWVMFTAAAKIDVRAMVVESGGERVSAAPLVVRNQTGKIALALPKSAAGYRWHEDDYLIIDCEAQQNSKANVKYEFKIGDKLFTMGYYLVPKRRVKMAIQLAELASRRWFLQTRPGAMKGHVSGSPTHIDKVDEVRITVEKGREPQSFTLYDAYLSRELPDFTVKGAPMVDQFGQWKDMDWAGKVKDEAAMVGFLRAEYDRALRDHDYP